MQLLLLGLCGAGKSTLGRLVAERLGTPFIDLDDRTAARLGAGSPGEALRACGEAPFREAEAAALESALGEGRGVIALGGGTPTAPGAAEMIRRGERDDRCRIVYLAATPSELALRLERADPAERPALTGKGAIEEIATLYQARNALYRELADRVLVAGSGAPAEHLDELLACARELGVTGD